MSNNEVNENSELYTQRSMEGLSSPDQLKDYLKVTGTPVWIVMIAVLLLLVGIFLWGAAATLTSYTPVKGVVQNGVLSVTLQDASGEGVTFDEDGDTIVCRIGNVDAVLLVNGKDANGYSIASGEVALPEGTYDVRVGYRQIKAIELLLN